MPVTIKNLRVTVRVKGSKGDSPLHKPGRAERPSMEYAMPTSDSIVESGPDPNKTATLGKGAASHRSPISPRKADPRKVAERVYELMKREIIWSTMRGGIN